MPERDVTGTRYGALAKRLSQSGTERVVLSFDDVRRIVGALPPAAYRDRLWWRNTYETEQSTNGWLSVGWRMLSVDLPRETVTFVRAESALWQGLRSGLREAQQAWLIRPATVESAELVTDWLRSSYCTVAAPGLRKLPHSPSRRDIAEQVAEQFAYLGGGPRAGIVETLDTFINQMQAGDLVVALGGRRGDEVYAGEMTGAPVQIESKEGMVGCRREVRWLNAQAPLAREQLPEPLQARVKGHRTITDLTSHLELLKEAIGLTETEPEPGQVIPPQATQLRLTGAAEELAQDLLLDKEWLQEAIELLRRRKQVIFYGPPGTGKTYVARKLAEHAAGVDNVRLVQFHPAYSYEDFFEGFRPQRAEDGTGLVFELVPGPFRRLVERARKDPARPYVLVIDEINRAHPAKVFGELYFLLEYRNEPIELIYSPEDTDFRLPENVFLIGTMNTVDRSIAPVDIALRRRFAFIEFHPKQDPIKSLLRRWLKAKDLPADAADLLDELNARIEDPDLAVGPSYLMDESAYDGGGLDRIWKTMLMPLLEECFYGQNRNLEEDFGLAALRRRVAVRKKAEHEAEQDAEAGGETNARRNGQAGGQPGAL